MNSEDLIHESFPSPGDHYRKDFDKVANMDHLDPRSKKSQALQEAGKKASEDFNRRNPSGWNKPSGKLIHTFEPDE